MEDLCHNELIYGYTNSLFPMAEADSQEIFWYSPEPRAIIPLNTYKPSKSLRSIINKNLFEIKINSDFEKVMRCCAKPRTNETDTWISEELIQAYLNLHQIGYAHSVESYFENELVGGLYGVAIGAAFFGESMFYIKANASKVAFHFLVEILKAQNYFLLDTQFINDNVKRFGAIEISKVEYLERLRSAIKIEKVFGKI